MIQERIVSKFNKLYDAAASLAAANNAEATLLVRAPGRVNLIGEHTDYNDGFVLPMTINQAVWIALRPRKDGLVKIFAQDFEKSGQFDLSSFSNNSEHWLEYVKGTAWAFQEEGYRLNGWEGVIAGDVPLGAGLSSSAALELATARAFSAISDLDWDPAQMARLCLKAENEWVGLQCGIMDQMISAAGKANHALLIDCRSLETEPVPLPLNTAIVVMDTATRRGLVDSKYNERNTQCLAAAEYFGVAALRDVNMPMFEAKSAELDPLIRKRAHHVISENQRTLQAVEAMSQGDASTMGSLMNASHISLRDDFEVSSKELNVMVELAQSQPGCYGARMTGAGFGGCAVALVQTTAIEDFVKTVARDYSLETDFEPKLYICNATDGAAVIN